MSLSHVAAEIEECLHSSAYVGTETKVVCVPPSEYGADRVDGAGVAGVDCESS